MRNAWTSRFWPSFIELKGAQPARATRRSPYRDAAKEGSAAPAVARVGGLWVWRRAQLHFDCNFFCEKALVANGEAGRDRTRTT
jgi:hypothetical protein